MENRCVSCKEEVGEEDKAVECDLCDQWEHMLCVRSADRPTESMYQALMENRSKAILYICTQCRKRGSIAKRLCKHDLEYERACEERLASARALNEAREQMQRAGAHHQERSRMQQQITELHDLLRMLGSNITAPRTAEALESVATATVESPISRREVTVETGTVTVDRRRSSSSESPSDEDHLPPVPTECRPPPAFKDLRSRLDKFSGKPGDGDFEIWLEDYLEATQNCGWSNVAEGSLVFLVHHWTSQNNMAANPHNRRQVVMGENCDCV